MATIQSILNNTAHRPWPMPEGRWQYYQEWNHAIFLHWKVPVELLQELVPSGLELDSFDGQYYVSLVAFTMQDIRPRNLPPIEMISDFDEINIRTYIRNGNKAGVYFISIEAGKSVSAFIARTMSGLPYQKSTTRRSDKQYHSKNEKRNFLLDIHFIAGDPVAEKTALDTWLTERYCLYLDAGKRLYRYEIHHDEWKIRKIDIQHLVVDYRLGRIDLSSHIPDMVHYSDGVKVIAWEKQPL